MPRKPRMLFIPLDVEFFDNAKILEAGEKAGWLYLAMGTRAKRLKTDGVLTRLQIERLHIQGWQKRLASLITAGLVVEIDEGIYWIVGWLDRNPSLEELTNYRRKDSARKRADHSARNPDGIRADSAPEEEEEVREEVEVKPGTLRSVAGGAR